MAKIVRVLLEIWMNSIGLGFTNLIGLFCYIYSTFYILPFLLASCHWSVWILCYIFVCYVYHGLLGHTYLIRTRKSHFISTDQEPQGAKSKNSEIDLESQSGAENENQPGKVDKNGTPWHMCTVCNVLAPPRSWHCKYCKACILRRDHHCIFVGTCIGEENHINFLGFMLFLGFGSNLVFFLLMFQISMETDTNVFITTGWTLLKVGTLYMVYFEFSLMNLWIMLLAQGMIAGTIMTVIFFQQAIRAQTSYDSKKKINRIENLGSNEENAFQRRWDLLEEFLGRKFLWQLFFPFYPVSVKENQDSEV